MTDEQIIRETLEEWDLGDSDVLEALDRLVAERDAAADSWAVVVRAYEAAESRIATLEAVVRRLVFFREALVAGEFEPGSRTVRELVDDACAALAAATPPAEERTQLVGDGQTFWLRRAHNLHDPSAPHSDRED